MHETLITAVLIYLALGIGAGMLSGLLGAGGGLVMVPGLMFLFHLDHTVNPAFMMHVAVGTSLASMIPITVRSLLSHLKRGVVFFAVYQKMLAGLLFGVFARAFYSFDCVASDVWSFCIDDGICVGAKTKRHGSKKITGKMGIFCCRIIDRCFDGIVGNWR